jgi:cyclophilin family peptidyl-prolyl cis-trans isomerase
MSYIDSPAVSKAAKRERQRLNREARRQYQETIERRRRTFKAARGLAFVVIPVIAVGAVLSLSSGGDEKSAAVTAGCRDVRAPAPKRDSFDAAPPLTIDTSKTYRAVVQTSCGSFTIELAPSQAPQTVNSFVFLAGQGFYDGTTFHRIVKDFVIQGGDPAGDGTGGPGYTLPDEPPADGYQQGTVAMANAGPGTTGSQFYVVTSGRGAEVLNSQTTEDGKYSYSLLGQVTEGFETVEKIERLGTKSEDGAPKAVVVIQKVTIEAVDPTATTLTPPSS